MVPNTKRYGTNKSEPLLVSKCRSQVVLSNVINLVFCVLCVNQSLLIAEIHQHSITSTTLTWLRPPRPSHGLRCEIIWIYLVFCVLYVNQSLLIAEIYQHSVTSTTLTWLRPARSIGDQSTQKNQNSITNEKRIYSTL